MDSLAKTVSELERKAATLPQTSPPKPGMTESRRVQVLRMYKEGNARNRSPPPSAYLLTRWTFL